MFQPKELKHMEDVKMVAGGSQMEGGAGEVKSQLGGFRDFFSSF